MASWTGDVVSVKGMVPPCRPLTTPRATPPQDAPCHLDLSKLIQAGTKAFFNNPVLSDLTLVCPDGRTLHCHSVILAAASRRFASQMPVKGVDSEALETLVNSFYTAECPLELSRVPALYDAAIKLEVSSLAPALEQYLASALQPHNCCSVLELCLGVGVAQLAELVMGWIRG
ncbi:Kelch-like protein 23, partial [Tetrabaena socialis]